MVRPQISKVFQKMPWFFSYPASLNTNLGNERRRASFLLMSLSQIVSPTACFIPISGCSVNHPIICFQCGFYAFFANLLIGNLEYAKAKLRHPDSVIQFNFIHKNPPLVSYRFFEALMLCRR